MNSWRRRPIMQTQASRYIMGLLLQEFIPSGMGVQRSIMQTQASRYVFPALGALYERFQRFAYPILRVAFGLWFIPHGCQKLFGWWGGNIAGVAKGMAAAGIETGMVWGD